MHLQAVLLAAALALVPVATRAADLVVWWDKGFAPGEDEAAHEILAAFETETGKKVDLLFGTPDELPGWTLAAVEAGHPPDFVFGVQSYLRRWASEGRLVD